MNDLAKNIVLWIVIAVVVATVVSNFSTRAGAEPEIPYSTFLEQIKDGTILFAVDQQQYVQGYLPVVMLTLYKSNLNTIGGGHPVLTGPGFVTKDNASQVADLAKAGTR